MTITSLGGIGGSFFTPIINYPEVAILGVGRSEKNQIFMNGKFQTRTMLPISLSYGHRINTIFFYWYSNLFLVKDTSVKQNKLKQVNLIVIYEFKHPNCISIDKFLPCTHVLYQLCKDKIKSEHKLILWT